MNTRAQAHLWLAQRVSAAVLAICVFVHLATMIYAVRGGLSAAEILGRTSGNVAWFAFYTVFVLAIAVHVPIGLRAVLAEWGGWRGRARDFVLAGFSVYLVYAGMLAVKAVFR